MSAEPGLTVDIYIDGVCSGNSGPGGWGVLLTYGRHEKTLFGGEASATTGGRMELTAMIQAFNSLTRPSEVRVHADSTYLSDGVTRSLPDPETGDRSTRLENPTENLDLWRQLSIVMEPHKVSWCQNSDHTRSPNIGRADRLAVEGRQQAIAEQDESLAAISARPPDSEQTPVHQASSDNGECVHEMPINWCSLCKPPRPGVLPNGYRTKGGNAYHNDPNCTWLDRGQRRAGQQGKNVHDKVRIAWGDVTPGDLEPCEFCCTPQWVKRHGH